MTIAATDAIFQWISQLLCSIFIQPIFFWLAFEVMWNSAKALSRVKVCGFLCLSSVCIIKRNLNTLQVICLWQMCAGCYLPHDLPGGCFQTVCVGFCWNWSWTKQVMLLSPPFPFSKMNTVCIQNVWMTLLSSRNFPILHKLSEITCDGSEGSPKFPRINNIQLRTMYQVYSVLPEFYPEVFPYIVINYVNCLIHSGLKWFFASVSIKNYACFMTSNKRLHCLVVNQFLNCFPFSVILTRQALSSFFSMLVVFLFLPWPPWLSLYTCTVVLYPQAFILWGGLLKKSWFGLFVPATFMLGQFVS